MDDVGERILRAGLAIACGAAVAGCAITSWQDPYGHGHDDRGSAFEKSEAGLAMARERASITCRAPDVCDAIWQRTRAYVAEHSPTRIRRADAGAIETERPHEFGVAYFWAERIACEDGSTRIRLKGLCRGMYDSVGGPGWTYRQCAPQIEQAQTAFARAVAPPG
ncbi:hypothetical protein [Paraburkholderia sp. SOS3]|jgi:hypothetical protein|uniref:hypothetical protein n=1 Tax=Paraburkholderia sp. SOS3 TaxID=1926494 RepID=UPI000947583F|nr:hypothetical protein [Paraburkholderia sp. SOS3]APR39302.1 hypothetical protein BTO02_28790 [Paraburkholderia sp. SOS3]